MRILFVFPDHMRARSRPIAVALLSAVAKKAGHECAYFDSSDYLKEVKGESAGVEMLLFKRFKFPEHLKYRPTMRPEDGLRKMVDEFKPDLLAVSVNYLLFKNALHLVRSLGENRPPTVFGGIHVTLNAEDVIANPEVDMACLGEGEDPFRDLLERMSTGGDLTNIPNIWTKKDGKVHRNFPRPLMDNMDELPLPDWSLFPDHHYWKPYVGDIYRAGDVFISRGCVNSCAYCFYHAYFKVYDCRNKVIFMSPERSIKEIMHLVDNWGVTLIKMRDSDFTARSAASLREIVRLKREIDPAKWPKLLCNVNHFSMTEEKVKLMRQLNMVSISIGLESGSEHLRRTVLNRRGNTQKLLDCCRWIRENGIRLTTANMIGIPTETREQIMETVALNKNGKVDLADVSVLFPFPGTQIHETAKQLGFLKRSLDDEDYFRGEPVLDQPQLAREDLAGLARTFQMYLHGPKALYPLIRLAEGEGTFSQFLYRNLTKAFYHYMFGIKAPWRDRQRQLRWEALNRQEAKEDKA